MNSPTTTEPVSPTTGTIPEPTPKRWTVGTLTYTRAQLGVLFFWLLWGDFAWSMKDRSVGGIAQLLLKHYQASDVMMSVFLVALPAAIGIGLGPMVSFNSDRHRGKWGRRIPFMAVATPFVVISTIGLGFSPMIGRALSYSSLAGHMSANQSVLLVMGLFWVLFEVSTVTANAVFGALVNDVVPHEFLGRFYGLFRGLSLIAGILFGSKLLGQASKHYMIIFIGVGILYGLGLLAMCLKVKEGQYPPVNESEEAGYTGVVGKAQLYLRECFSHPFYRWVIASFVIAGVAFLPVNSFSQPYAQNLGISMSVYGKFLATTYAISLACSYFLGMLADKFHPLRMSVITLAIYAGVTFFGGFAASDPKMFGAIFVAHGVLSGAYFTSSASLGQRLFPKMRFAQFASAAGMSGAFANMIVAPLVGSFLDASHHQYRYTFHMGCAFATTGTVLLVVVYRKIGLFGGLKAYVAPDQPTGEQDQNGVMLGETLSH